MSAMSMGDPTDSTATRKRPVLRSEGSTYLGKVCPSCLGRYPVDFRVCPRDATELDDAGEDEDSLIGTVVGDTFQIVRAIGEGGMAKVYEARHIRLSNKRFAVKVLNANYAQQPMVIARFQREAEAASGIAHPNVMDVFDVSRTPEGLPYLVSEYLDGKDFATLLDEREKVDAPTAIRVVRQVCRALAAAHGRGVVHRDVKPENVFLVGDPDFPVVKVLDFGISRVDAAGGATLTQTGMIMGTPGYIPPEQARGARADLRADIYGVGAMLYRALTGRLPFDSDDPGEALSLVLTQEPAQPRSIEPTIPVALEMVIQKAMAKDPADRHQSMAELDEDLAAFDTEGRPSMVGAPAPGPRTTVHAGASPKTARSATHLDVARVTREASLARPTVIALSGCAYAWAVACLVDLLTTAFASFTRGSEPPTSTERLIVAITIVAASITPAVFWVRHLRAIWGNSVRTVAAAQTLRRVMLAATISYAALMLAGRLFAPNEFAVVALVSTVLSLSAAGVNYELERREGQRRRALTAVSAKS